ncbi:flagellar protein FlgN [Jeotgalibacillus aurantiacus]|uniref:flagellar protein FlgN n=1 Tax=Jeotgalibacillus aurantiacus TaxID=2763266 RepID=UPI001D0A8EB4|nr:flagellar protein FlgN [Jeotgalibacillus aurantiacus]
MSELTLKSLLEQLIELHQSLLDLALEKTVIIKSGDLQELQRIIKEEQKYIYSIQTIEKKRQQILTMPADIEETKSKLLSVILDLKAVNELNQELLEQSMQFVTLNLDLLMPQPDSFNYKKEDDEHQPVQSIFDSQA